MKFAWFSLLPAMCLGLHRCSEEDICVSRGNDMPFSNDGPVNIERLCGDPRQMQNIQIGLVIDEGFFAHFGHNYDFLMDYVDSVIFEQTNSIYQTQFSVHLERGDVHVGNSSFPNYSNLTPDHYWWLDGPDTTTGCTLSYDQITNIRQWQWDKKKSSEDLHGTWIYLAGCWDGFGIAPVGTMCETNWLNAGVVNYDKEQTWMSFAHELGHIFGAGHFFDGGNGGIMDYGAQLYDHISQFRKNDNNEICANLQKLHCPALIKQSPKYSWQLTGKYTQCLPNCGPFRFKMEQIVCAWNAINTVDDKYCKSMTKPTAKFSPCPANTCIEPPHISVMKWHKLPAKIINPDAAFTGLDNEVYFLKNDQIFQYIHQTPLQCINNQYPKNFAEAFKITIANFKSHIDAAFRVENMLYLIKNRQYIKINWTTQQLVVGQPIKIKPKNNNTEFGYIPDAFWQCTLKYPIQAAFAINELVTLNCRSLFYTFHMKINGAYDNVYRPFEPILFLDKISAISVLEAKILRIYVNDSYTDINK